MNITNNSNIPLALAVWLVHDEYDYVNEPNYVSVTKLMKPIRHLVLPGRVPPALREMDLSDFVSSAIGKSLHDSIEKAWIRGKNTNLKKLGYPQSVIDRVLVNPEPEDLKPDTVPVYLEQRAFKKVTVNGVEFTIGGKFDLVAEGIVHDNKSTSAMTWLFGTKDDDYRLQGSLYRWLNPDKITEDFIRINFIFTDWSKVMARANPKYPQNRCTYKDVPLMTLEETEQWVKDKLASFMAYADADEIDIPHCTDEELWLSDPVYKYYSDPAKTTGRSTKNFDDLKEAKIHIASKGNKGVLITKPGEPKRCGYCEAFLSAPKRRSILIDLTGVTHHPAVTEIVDVLCNKTTNTDRGFFHVEICYFLAKMASSQRATIVTKDRGEIPVNTYALALATSGFGKGHSVNIMEHEFMKGFKKRFMEETMPVIAEKHLWDIANDRALRAASDPQEEFNSVEAEFKRAGAFPFTFDSGTTPAVKQLIHKLRLANCGSINLQIDEIGSNLIESTDLMTLFLELYDQGLVKQKLTKNTAENTRGEEIDGKTPTNMLLFGTPSKLLDGGQTEDHFYSFLDTGYARRCLFGIGQHDRKAFNTMTPAEIYQKLISTGNSSMVDKWSNHFHDLADPARFGWKMTVDEPVAIRLLEYKIACERAADAMADHEEIRKAELSHRYFKALKLAGAYAFVDGSSEIEMEHYMQAVLLVEESGAAFQSILNREKAYVKLAKYIASIEEEVTHADLLEALPFYKSGNAARNEMMTLATAWGYKKHIIIKKTFVDGIEFFKGEKLKETNLDEIFISYSNHWAYDYLGEKVPFDQLGVVAQAEDMHWANHHFKRGHRAEENVLAGFNLVVIDVDEGHNLEFAHELLKDYKFMTYTTKRHQTEGYGDRFRLVLPINYELTLDAEEYKEFMNNVVGWLPFKVDEAANQRSRKWESFAGGQIHFNLDGETLDALPFIPKTSKNAEYTKNFQQVQSLDNLERWFASRIASGNRNNQMLKYALALVDNGMNLMEVTQQVHAFNGKLNAPLDKDELDSTILVTVAKRFTAR